MCVYRGVTVYRGIESEPASKVEFLTGGVRTVRRRSPADRVSPYGPALSRDVIPTVLYYYNDVLT